MAEYALPDDRLVVGRREAGGSRHLLGGFAQLGQPNADVTAVFHLEEHGQFLKWGVPRALAQSGHRRVHCVRACL